MTDTLTLPSGMKIEVRPPGPMALNFCRLIADKRNGETSMEAQLLEAQAVCSCTVKPRLTITDPAPQGQRYFDEMEIKDWLALLEWFAGAVQEATKDIRPLSTETQPSL